MEPYQINKLPITRKGHPTVELRHRSKKGMTLDAIRKVVQKESNDLKKKKKFNGKIEVAVEYDFGWRSGYFTDVGSCIAMYADDYDDGTNQKTFHKFAVYVMKS